MKESEYFRRAYRDSVFRQAKLDDLRYYRAVSLGLLVFSALIAGILVVSIGFGEGWKVVFEKSFMTAFPPVVMSAWGYSRFSTLIAALTAMDAQKPDNTSA